MQHNSTTVLDSEIRYDCATRDYAIIVGGETIGYGRNYAEAEQIRTQALAKRAGSAWSGR